MSGKRAGRIRRRIVGVLAPVVIAASVGVVQAAPANAIEPCTFWTPNPLSIAADPWGGGPWTCWANAGTRYVNLPNMKLMESGNNAGSIAYTAAGGQRRTHTFGKYQRYWLNGEGIMGSSVTVTRITIY